MIKRFHCWILGSLFVVGGILFADNGEVATATNSTITIEPSKEIRYPSRSDEDPQKQPQAPNQGPFVPFEEALTDTSLPPGWFLRLDWPVENTKEIQDQVSALQAQFSPQGRLWLQEGSSGHRYWVGPLTLEGSRAFLKTLYQGLWPKLSFSLVKISR